MRKYKMIFGEISLFVRDKNILWFVAGTYLVTWVLWIAAFKVNGFFRIIGSFVPSFMGIIFICRKNKKSGLKTLISSVKRYKVKWYLYFLLYSIRSYPFYSLFIY